MPAPFPGQQPLQASRHTRHISLPLPQFAQRHGEYALVGQRGADQPMVVEPIGRSQVGESTAGSLLSTGM